MTARKFIFWLHLGTGIGAGLVIAIMCVTGAVLAFENQIIAWAERDARLVPTPPAGATRLSVDETLAAFARAHPEVKPQSFTVSRDPAAAVLISAGREDNYYVDPFDGAIRQPASSVARNLMQRLTEWHRWLGQSGGARAPARFLTGVCNLALLFLALSGAVLWWPRKWRTKGLRRSLWFLRQASGRAREWNWHNVIGFWLLPVLITLSATGVVLSFRPVNDWIFRLAGDSPPGRNAGPVRPAPLLLTAPSSGARPLEAAALLDCVRREFPHWQSITMFLDPRNPAAGQGGRPPAFLTVKSTDAWPRVATSDVALDPFTGAVRHIDAFRDLSPGRRARTWIRFLHSGEALGAGGQMIAGLGCLGGCLLVYTGFALAWRRFRGEKKISPAAEPNGLG
ncbi:MAG TPA: PepSY-associated TM helix domain-containing protein [Lacunisphaera sp.]|jgi:uncharacterized iron-regulated membrane protein|nr:PepSY-associated TM helix domain-containing protein [Lacunisphaera sp.]